MRFTNLGLQMRGAVESRRLVQLDGVNAGRVVAVAWAISSLMAGLAGVLLAPALRPAPVPGLRHADGGRLRRRRLGRPALHAHRRPGRRSSWAWPPPCSRATCRPSSVWSSAALSVPPLRRAGGRPAHRARAAQARRRQGPAGLGRPADARRPPRPCGPRRWTGSSGSLWYVLLAAFVVSMLTWMPKTWENVFNAGLAFSMIFLSITLITGMGGQLSLCQATLAGVGAFTAAQLANHLGPQPPGRRAGRGGGGRRGGRRPGRGLAAAARPGPGPHDHRRRPVLRQRHLPPDLDQQRLAAQRAAEVGGPGHPQSRTAMPSSSWPWSSWSSASSASCWSARAPPAGTWPPCGGARRRRPGWAST